MLKKINFKDEYVCIITGLVANCVLTIIKFFAGIFGHSQAMIADAINSLFDVLSSVIIYLGIKMGKKPEDDEHPYGHENIEVIVSWIVSIIVLSTGLFLGYSAFHTIVDKNYSHPSSIALWAAIITIIIKEILHRYTLKVGNILNSPAIKANAFDHRSDVLASLSVLIGIAGARMGWLFLDPVASLVVSVFIMRTGANIMKQSNRIIMDAVPSEEFVREIKEFILRYSEIKEFSNLRVHPIGRNYIIDVSIFVSKDYTVSKGHDIATNLSEALIKDKPFLKDVIIHVEPYSED
ncbi:MAG: cation diffusion facilitator family transporter [Elusimicrobiota bacterium]|nr:cation diffusion facilitator family transporter [Elusimicrobiota bacterium]